MDKNCDFGNICECYQCDRYSRCVLFEDADLLSPPDIRTTDTLCTEKQPLREKNKKIKKNGNASRSSSTYELNRDKQVEKRNARERRRVHAVNMAFVRLKKVVPIQNISLKCVCVITYGQIMTSEDLSEQFKHATIDFVAGIMGGISYVYVGQPLDTCKTKMQAFPLLYKSGLQCLLKTARHDGLRGLYAGTLPSLITSTSEYSILFFSYSGVKKFLKHMMGVPYSLNMSNLFYGSAGALASFFSSLTICPTELVKSRVQVQRELAKYKFGGRKEFIGPSQVVKDIIKQDGFRGLFRGLSPTLAREMPGYFVYFYTYEYMRNLLRRPDQRKWEIGPLKTMVAGSAAGGMFWTSTFPIDVIKSRIQVSSTKDNMFVLGYKILRGKRISKVKTLQSAIKYIRELELILQTSDYVNSYSYFEEKYLL